MNTWLARLRSRSFLRASGLLGSVVITLGVILSALTYRGKGGQPYSFFNHFISELGEVGVAPQAAAFNFGLILGGFLFLLFMLGLGSALPGFWPKVGMLLGAVAALFLALVGVFPMNRLDPHILVALTYFRAALLALIVFTIAIFRQPSGRQVVPKAVNWSGLLAIACYAAFLVVLQVRGSEVELMLNPSQIGQRPDFWLTPLLEWGIFVSTQLWFLVTALSVRKPPDPGR